MKDVTTTITVNGLPLSEFIGEEKAKEIETIRVEIVNSISKTLYHPKLHVGRGPGKPKGLRRAKVYSKEEIAEVNRQQGYTPAKGA